MTRYGPIHKAIILFILDRGWYTRSEIEEEVHRVMLRRHSIDPEKRHMPPAAGRWAGGTTRSLGWMATNGWLDMKRFHHSKFDEWFRINRTKAKRYRNWMRAYEQDKARGVVRSDGIYEFKNGNDRKEQREIFRILASRASKATGMGR